MSDKSNDNGRAFEYITIITLEEEIRKIRNVELENNSSLIAAKNAYDKIGLELQNNLLKSAKSAVDMIFELEPLILEKDNDILTLKIQKDFEGETGDVRDILIIRSGIKWEIGLSLKHNHFAVKHSRLSRKLDFGESWFGIPCSKNYWNAINPIFEYIESEKTNGKNWRDLPNKIDDVYIPILNAFVNEVQYAMNRDKNVPKKMVEYLLGKFDFYKVISIDSKKIAEILTFNLRGTLNQSSKTKRPKTIIPLSELPTRIIKIGLIPKSTNTVELVMDKGWSFSFRIHNASTKVETSLKFDIQIIGIPATIIAINCIWK